MDIQILLADARQHPPPGDRKPAVDRIAAAINAQPNLIRLRICTTEPCENPSVCAIGALLIAAGVSSSALANCPNKVICFPFDLLELLALRYGLSKRHLELIASVNDSAIHQDRKAAVLRCVAALV